MNWFALIPWALAAAGAGGTLYFRGELAQCELSVAVDANKAEEKLRRNQAADAELRRQLSTSLAPILEDLRKQANDTQLALARVASTAGCGNTPAAGAFDRVVRPGSGGQAHPGAPGAARP